MKFNQAQKKRKEHPVDMLANKTKTELLAEAHSAGIKGSSMHRRRYLLFAPTAAKKILTIHLLNS
jgi:hypothetical protein